MKETPVLIVGAGPIGLTASILLADQGVESLVIDQKPEFGDHPRARFMDSCTLELFRQMGIADEVEATGIGPTWTKTVNCFTTFVDEPIAKVPSPEFYSVPRPITPQVPVMTCQDLMEPIIYRRAQAVGVEVQLNRELLSLSQNDSGCTATIRDRETGADSEIRSQYVIGADGVKSRVREAIGCELEGEVRDTFYRDVLFHADMSRWLDAKDNQGALLWVAHAMGAGMFQPLDGKSRFRAQISGLDPDQEIDDDWCKAWIRAAVGADEDLPIEIFSKLIWRVSARTSSRFGVGRIFLAGDAAHVFTPTGGMGMNTAFAGVRNLAWKLAYAVRGVAPASILESYETEWKPQALWRTSVALENHDYIAGVYRAHFSGGDVTAALKKFEQYTDYPGVIFGYELDTDLCQGDPASPPEVASAVREYVPVVRCGRRAPHSWLDENGERSVLDWFGTDYVLVLSPAAGEEWESTVATIRDAGFPIRVERLTQAQAAGTPYSDEVAVLVRPDLIVAAHTGSDKAVAPATLLRSVLPTAA